MADPGVDRELVLLEAHARTAAIAEATTAELGLDIVERDGNASRKALDDDDEGRTVGTPPP